MHAPASNLCDLVRGSGREVEGVCGARVPRGSIMGLRGGWGEGAAGSMDTGEAGEGGADGGEQGQGGEEMARCPHGRVDGRRGGEHCMECEVMAFLQVDQWIPTPPCPLPRSAIPLPQPPLIQNEDDRVHSVGEHLGSRSAMAEF